MTRCVLPVALLTSTAPPEPTRTHTKVLTRWALTHDSCGEAGRGPPCGETVKLLAAVESTLATLRATSTTTEHRRPSTSADADLRYRRGRGDRAATDARNASVRRRSPSHGRLHVVSGCECRCRCDTVRDYDREPRSHESHRACERRTRGRHS